MDSGSTGEQRLTFMFAVQKLGRHVWPTLMFPFAKDYIVSNCITDSWPTYLCSLLIPEAIEFRTLIMSLFSVENISDLPRNK